MPKVKCTWCERTYEVPDAAIGQVAKCACGKKFRVGGQTSHVATSVVTGSSHASTMPHVAPPPRPRAGTMGELPPGLRGHAEQELGLPEIQVASPPTVRKVVPPCDDEEPHQPLLRSIDIAFRVTCVAVAVGAWYWIYLQLEQNFDENALLPALPFSLLILPILLVLGGSLAWLGINYQPGSSKIRLEAFGVMGVALIVAVAMVAMEYALRTFLGATGFISVRNYGLGGVIFFLGAGIIQIVTGSDMTGKLRDTWLNRG